MCLIYDSQQPEKHSKCFHVLYYGCMPAHVISATSLHCVTQLLPCAHMITSSTPNSPTPYSNIAVSSHTTAHSMGTRPTVIM